MAKLCPSFSSSPQSSFLNDIMSSNCLINDEFYISPDPLDVLGELPSIYSDIQKMELEDGIEGAGEECCSFGKRMRSKVSEDGVGGELTNLGSGDNRDGHASGLDWNDHDVKPELLANHDLMWSASICGNVVGTNKTSSSSLTYHKSTAVTVSARGAGSSDMSLSNSWSKSYPPVDRYSTNRQQQITESPSKQLSQLCLDQTQQQPQHSESKLPSIKVEIKSEPLDEWEFESGDDGSSCNAHVAQYEQLHTRETPFFLKSHAPPSSALLLKSDGLDVLLKHPQLEEQQELAPLHCHSVGVSQDYLLSEPISVVVTSTTTTTTTTAVGVRALTKLTNDSVITTMATSSSSTNETFRTATISSSGNGENRRLCWYQRPDTPHSLDDESPPSEFKHAVDLNACVVGSNNIALTGLQFIQQVSQELQDMSKVQIESRLGSEFSLNEVLDVISTETFNSGSSNYQETAAVKTDSFGATEYSSSSSSNGEETISPPGIASSNSSGANISMLNENDFVDVDSVQSVPSLLLDPSAWLLMPSSGSFNNDGLPHDSSSSSSENNSVANSTSESDSKGERRNDAGDSRSKVGIEHHQHTDHSYTRFNGGTDELSTNLDTPSDSEDEIDVVSVNDRKLPTNPSDSDRRALQSKVAHRFISKKAEKLARAALDATRVSTTVTTTATVASTGVSVTSGAFEFLYTPTTSSPVKSVNNSRHPSPAVTPSQTTFPTNLTAASSYGNGSKAKSSDKIIAGATSNLMSVLKGGLSGLNRKRLLVSDSRNGGNIILNANGGAPATVIKNVGILKKHASDVLLYGAKLLNVTSKTGKINGFNGAGLGFVQNGVLKHLSKDNSLITIGHIANVQQQQEPSPSSPPPLKKSRLRCPGTGIDDDILAEYCTPPPLLFDDCNILGLDTVDVKDGVLSKENTGSSLSNCSSSSSSNGATLSAVKSAAKGGNRLQKRSNNSILATASAVAATVAAGGSVMVGNGNVIGTAGGESNEETIINIVKRHLHNDMERQRRIGLKNLFDELKEHVPNIKEKDRAPKVTILREAALLCKAVTQEDAALITERAQLQTILQNRHLLIQELRQRYQQVLPSVLIKQD